MSSNDTKKNFEIFPEFKFPMNQSHNNSLIEELPSNTPHKDIFLQLKPQMNMNNLLLNINTSNISPNKYLFDPRLFINGYNSGNKNSNSGFAQDKMNSNSLIYFNNSTNKDKKLIGKKRKLFKYILSSEKKGQNRNNINIKNTNVKNINVNITQICLHRYHLLNLHLIDNSNDKFNLKNIPFSNKTIKFMKKKFPFLNIISNKTDKKEIEVNLNKINLSLEELKENNLDYFQNENDCEKILQNYWDEMQNILEKIKSDYLSKKKTIYISKNILLLELLIRNWNLFTNYIMAKYSQENNNLNNNNIQENNFPLGKFILFSTKQTIPLTKKKFFAENLPENHTTTTKKENILILNENNNINNISSLNKQKTTLFKAKIPSSNEYKCDFCERVFKNGQALGGHISQSHPKKSYKYKQKIEIRNKRTKRRELLYKARRHLFSAYNIDLDYLLKNKRKNEIKNFIKVHKAEYKKELISMKNNCNKGIILNSVIKGENINENNNNSDLSNNIDIDIDINTSSKEKDK
jgi:hypothetical protein